LSDSHTAANSALARLKVVEIAQVIAGPMAGTLLADLGADVVHVEDPEIGDPQRTTGIPNQDGVYLWWKVSGRNKRSVTLDLRHAEGQELARRLIAWADVLITNFRVGTFEKWGLGRMEDAVEICREVHSHYLRRPIPGSRTY
jgi:formyl-CoA transferase